MNTLQRQQLQTLYKDRTDLLLPDEDCWQQPPPPRPQNWTTTDDVVRLYVLQDPGEER